MTFDVKIFGAGSIGNHLANACRRKNWNVVMCDIEKSALERTKNQIYPDRYGKWDNSIRLFENKNQPKDPVDLIIVGTPPDTHLQIALEAILEKPRAILIEKPVCGLDLKGASKLIELAKSNDTSLFVGYDHVVSKVTQHASELVSEGRCGKLLTLDVEFREHWGGIFKAHPWLAGPWETYLGFSEKGGGASGEHSHAINLWQHLALVAGEGRVVEVQAMMDFVKDDRVKYDSVCAMHLRTETGLMGRCIQDVVTQPSKKCARLQFDKGCIEWSMTPQLDRLTCQLEAGDEQTKEFSKTRPDDFIAELSHIETAIGAASDASPIALSRGLESMLVIAAAHLSNKTGRVVAIDYSAGSSLDALSIK